MDPQELVPLEAAIPRPPTSKYCSHLASRSCFRGPIRICRLLTLLIFLPSIFIIVPLYMKYRVFGGQMYPMGMSDMRLIDSKISTTWCQRQVVKSNATFNAYVLPGQPEMQNDLVPVSMTRELVLEDDMKEYWGFYLLKGSTVTVSTCVSQPGASLIMIKGYKHLQDCAYIGDDSSEELDELKKANELGLLSDDLLREKILKKIDGKANDPGAMKRHKAGVNFHDPSQAANHTDSEENVPLVDVTDHDPKVLEEMLDKLHQMRYHPPANLMAVPGMHRHRDTNVDREERKFLSFKDIDGNNSDQVTNKSPDKTETTTAKEDLTLKVHPKLKVAATSDDKLLGNKRTSIKSVNENHLRYEHTKYTTTTATTELPDLTSKELYDVRKRLKAMGERGKKLLAKITNLMDSNEISPEKHLESSTMKPITEEKLERWRRVVEEAYEEENTKAQRQQRRREAREEARAKRELMLGQIELQKELNEDDEARDYAAEEGLTPDGVAEHHNKLNETTAFDMSNSEYWSSFSSSEEALLECDGLILNLPLTPHDSCRAGVPDAESDAATKSNAFTYRVPSNGYYFFVFNSENEVHPNFIKTRFDLQKTRYDVARSALRECRNTTDRCDLSLDIFSSQKVVLEVPLSNNDSLWNEHFVITSECEPRTSLYLVCVIAVPILIMMFAFQ